MNQCDGCQAGIPVDANGQHRMGKPGGYSDLMTCQASKYVEVVRFPKLCKTCKLPLTVIKKLSGAWRYECNRCPEETP